MHLANKDAGSVKPGAKHGHCQGYRWKHNGNESVFDIHVLCFIIKIQEI